MLIHVLTLFPELVEEPLRHSIVGRALTAGHVTVRAHDIRSFSTNKHAKVDDSPYGGGPGMVMTPQPLVDAIEAVRATCERPHVIVFSPAGRPFDQARARALAAAEVQPILVCGRYEGIDQRVIDGWADEELSIGDYVMTGGELAALVVIDVLARLIPGVLGNAHSSEEESIGDGWLEYGQYTRPPVFRDRPVPPVLLSGNHDAIRRHRRRESLVRTRERRPDLFSDLTLSTSDTKLLES